MQQSDTFICPATKLPIRHRPEWNKVSLGENYQLSIDLIGEQIILTHGSGLPSPKSARAALDLMEKIISEYLPDRPYIQIFDYNNITNHSMEARRIVIQRLKQRKRMRGAVYYGLNPMMQASVLIARFFRQLQFPLLIAGNYIEAVNLALGLLDDHRRVPLIREEGKKIDHRTNLLLEQIGNPDRARDEADAESLDRLEKRALELLEDERRQALSGAEQFHNQEVLKRLEEIIRRRNERARSYQRKKSEPDAG